MSPGGAGTAEDQLDALRKRFDVVETVVSYRRRFLRDVPVEYRVNFVVISTGLVLLVSSGVMGRVMKAGLVGSMGVVLLAPEISPWKGR